MRADEITLGWYRAHGSKTPDLEVTIVYPLADGRIAVGYTWNGKQDMSYSRPEKTWALTRPDYVIEELELV